MAKTPTPWMSRIPPTSMVAHSSCPIQIRASSFNSSNLVKVIVEDASIAFQTSKWSKEDEETFTSLAGVGVEWETGPPNEFRGVTNPNNNCSATWTNRMNFELDSNIRHDSMLNFCTFFAELNGIFLTLSQLVVVEHILFRLQVKVGC